MKAVRSSKLENLDLVDADTIVPSAIKHNVDKIYEGGRLSRRYNFVTNHFESASSEMTARAYLDDIETVALFGPFKSKSLTPMLDESLRESVLCYLIRRFHFIKEFGESGYDIIWQTKRERV